MIENITLKENYTFIHDFNDLVSGEKFQEVADIVCYSNITGNIAKQALGVSTSKMFRIGHDNPSRIQSSRIVFVYSNCIDLFIEKHEDHISPGTILITHNEDTCIKDNHLRLFEKGVKVWYAQNAVGSHENLIGIPIGIANSQWRHGDVNLLMSIRNNQMVKKRLVYKNFSVGTNETARNLCLRQTVQLCPMSVTDTQINYWTKLASSKYVVSPPGNGPDCHRIWESLYLRTIPIVLRDSSLRYFEDLPILFINSWRDIDSNKLDERYENRFAKVDWNAIPQLSINYWKWKIHSSLTPTV
jgi:hypothetical protein